MALTPVGAPGTAAVGATIAEVADAGPVPTAFVAVTVNEYGTPYVSPVTVNGLAIPVFTMLSGLEVTVYKVIGLPPLDAGAVKGTVT